MKYLTSALLLLLATQKVLGLQCYTTDLDKLENQGISEHYPSDCLEQLEQMLSSAHDQKLKSMEISFLEGIFRCYKVVVYADHRSMAIKGCLLNGGCEVVKKNFNHLPGVYQNVQSDCFECNGDLCNGARKGALSVMAAVFMVVALVF